VALVIPVNNKGNMYRILLIAIGSTCLFCSCRSTRNIQTAIAKKDTTTVTPVIIPAGNSHADSLATIKEIYNRIQQHKITYTTLSSKIEVDYQDADGKKYNVTAHLRMYKDSVIWISITAILGIEGLRALITPDSVKLLDKQNKVYSARSVEYLQEVSELPLDFSSLQDLIAGNIVFLDSNIVSYSKANGMISLLSAGEFFKNLLTVNENTGLVISSKLDDLDELRNRTCYLEYDDYETKGGMSFPTKRTINVTEKKKLEIALNFKQYDFNETLSFPFSIPKNYKRN
jgi:hypothetical protein